MHTLLLRFKQSCSIYTARHNSLSLNIRNIICHTTLLSSPIPFLPSSINMTVQKNFSYGPSFPMDYQEYYLSTFSFFQDDPNLLGVYHHTKPSEAQVIENDHTSVSTTVREAPDNSPEYPEPWDTAYCPGTGQEHELRGSECRYCSFDCHSESCPMTGRNHYMIGDYCYDCIYYSKPIYNLLATYKPNGTSNIGWEVFNAPTYRTTAPKGLSEKVMAAWKEIDERDYRVPTLKGNPEILARWRVNGKTNALVRFADLNVRKIVVLLRDHHSPADIAVITNQN
ncbi:hypothetical protein BZA77DRAFT_371241 [Pyronema omphalodes]|nr:hypothetical protein BZA77DRAFT_371241 [Pyronema omphalodes]